MRNLTISYKRFGFSRNIVRQIPSSYAELSQKQFIAIGRLYHGNISEAEFYHIFFSLPKHMPVLDWYMIYKMSEMVDFISHDNIIIDHFIIHELKGKLIAPGNRLKGMSFEQFMLVDTYFNRFVQTEKEDMLNMFIAHLYIRNNEYFVLPADLKNGLFSRKRKLDLDSRIKQIEKMDYDTKYAVFLNFVLIKRWLSKSFPFLFPESDEPADKHKKVKVQTVKWLDIFDSFVGDDIPAMDKYQTMPVTTAFRLMNRRIKDAQKRK